MSEAMLTIRSLRRHSSLLLALCLAFAVSHLFSVLPFGNASSGYMAPIPATAAQSLSAEQCWTVEPPVLSDSLTWEDGCQMIWAALPDVTIPIGTGAGARPGGLVQTAATPEIRARTAQRAPPAPPTHRYHLRAPPRDA